MFFFRNPFPAAFFICCRITDQIHLILSSLDKMPNKATSM
jgi:hypothetical protein